MSTKIYYAWRVSIERLNEFIDFVRPQIYDEGERILRELLPMVEDAHIAKKKQEHAWMPEQAIRLEASLELLKKTSLSTIRAPGLDVDFSLNIWLHEGMAYIVPIGEYREKLKVPDFAEDFSYWDNTDAPDGLTREMWIERENTWEKINLGTGICSHNARRLNHSVIDMGARNGDFDFEHEMRERLVENKKEAAQQDGQGSVEAKKEE